MTGPRLATIPPHLPFLDTLARTWLDTAGADPSEGLILLPTRRAARALAESFLHARGGRPMLLPRITALGAVDEAPLALAGALDLPPAVDPVVRLAALSRLVMALPPEHGGVAGADRAWALAAELAALMDEAEQAEVPLPEALARAADGAYAAHWEATLRFLDIVTAAWPAWLAERGLANPAARQVEALCAQAEAWAAAPPAGRVWAAGSTGAIPAAGRLLRVIAGLDQGLVVLPWLDASHGTADLAETHPQSGLHHLLAAMGATPADVAVWEGPPHAPPARGTLLAEALLPADTLDQWRAAPPPDTAGLSRLVAADQQEEAAAIAMILRDALERPGARAALVTPDRGLAGRVAAELARWGVVADDSAGEPLADTPQAVFLRLLARAWAEELAPVPLLALLKHPLAAAGLAPGACRAAARALERAALRGPRPAPGFVGLRQGQGRPLPEPAAALVESLRERLAPLLRLVPPNPYAPADLLAALIQSAEDLATTDARPGAARLWAGEEGQALAELLAAALPAWALLPDQPQAVLPGLLDALLAGVAVRGRRALRGRDSAHEHPRVFIWGLLEARLQAVDTVVLGGLTEGTWPPATDPGPWLSRPMRGRAGLPGADRGVGESAHDFVMAACAAPTAILSAPSRRDGAPAVPSRWLARLDARLGAAGLPRHPAALWARALDQPPERRARPAEPPMPRPPLALRPRRLSVSDVETLIADPYAIYAKHVLHLRPLDPLEQETDALDYGTLVHRGIELFLRDHADPWPADPAAALRTAMAAALIERAPRASLRNWWQPRLDRIADWVAAEDTRRRAVSPLARIAVEHRGTWSLGGFTLTAKADRIEIARDGGLAILDYKTGEPPDRAALHDGSAPQLPLEAAMAQAGAFPGITGRVRELAYWHLSGGREPGAVKAPLKTGAELAELVDDTPGHVRAMLEAFDDPAHPYPHCPHPARAPRRRDYAQLARAAERAAARDDP